MEPSTVQKKDLMRAVVCDRYGPPEVLELSEVERPTPEDDEVLVRVFASTVSAGDVRMRGFKVPPSYWLPARFMIGLRGPKWRIPGTDLAGEVEEMGKDVTKFEIGDHVFGGKQGANAEYVSVSERGLAKKPANVTFEEAAAVPFGGISALWFLRKGDVQRGDEVLIYGASGSVGTYAVQLAKHFGATVTGVCSTTNLELVESLGADEVIDYTEEDFTERDETYDIVFDTVGKASFSHCKDSLKEGGRYLETEIGLTHSVWRLWLSIASSKKIISAIASLEVDDLALLGELLEEGELRPVIDRRYPLEEIVEAHRYVDKGHKKGNVVITI